AHPARRLSSVNRAGSALPGGGAVGVFGKIPNFRDFAQNTRCKQFFRILKQINMPFFSNV
uniref:hypothetical protein n=1 Tax=Klebsiella pneumoniae TaxID=573 RepID=UPI001952F42D